jgi:outer membrane protein
MNPHKRISTALMASVMLASTLQAQETPNRPTLELSLDQAVERALKNNADLAVEKYRPESSAEDVRSALGAYDPFLTAQVSKNSADTPATNAFSGGAVVNTSNLNYNVGVSQYLPTGGQFRLDFLNTRTNTNNTFSSFNPAFDSNLNLSLTQPLLKDLTIDASRLQIRVSKNNRTISDIQFRQTVINTIANVKGLYYDIIAAIDNLDAQKKSLALAQKLLEENQIKVRVGTLAPLDVVAAESEVASREEGVIVAEATVASSEDALKTAIFPKNDPDTWALRIVPTDRPKAEQREVNAAAAIQTALEKRTDILATRKALENNDIQLKFARNQVLPTFDLVAGYGATGIGGTQLIRDEFGGPVITTIPGGYGDALSSVFGFDFPTWSVGVNFAYPLFNRQARAASAQASISKDQALANLTRLELEIAQEVRNAARGVETNYKRVQSTRAARTLQERRLDAEEKRFAAGMSTNFLVTQAQRDLADASVAEIRAILAYQKSLIEFDRSQEAGVGAGSGVVLSTSQSALSETVSTTPGSVTQSSQTGTLTQGTQAGSNGTAPQP